MKKHYTYLLILAACWQASIAHAQYDHLLHKTYAQRLESLLPFYNKDSVMAQDSAIFFSKINAIKKLAVDKDDDDLLMETSLMKTHYFFLKLSFPASLVLSMIDSLKTEAIKRKKIWAEAMAENLAALYNFDYLRNYEVAFEHRHKLYDLIKNMEPKDFPYKQNCLMQIADEYYFFNDFPESIFYNQEALKAEPLIKLHPYPMRLSILNTMGLCYQQLNMPDSSDYYFQQTHLLSEKNNSIAWEGISSGNLGYNMFLKKQYNEAMPLLEKDITIAAENKDWGLASGSLMVLGNISLNQNNISKANKQLHLAQQYAYRSEQYQRLQQLYPLLSKLYASLNQPALSAMYLDSALFVKDSLTRKLNALQLLRAKQKVDMQQYRAEIDIIKRSKQINILERNSLIIAIILIMTGVTWFYNEQRKKYRLQREQFIKAEEELAAASRQLDEFAKNIHEKNGLIEILQQQNGNNSSATNDLLHQLQQSTILTDYDWEFFRQLFEKVHGGFLHRLKEKLPGLTPAETRFLALNKLKLSNKEMAAMLGIGTDAIRQYRSRLRKKLNLSEEENLEDLVARI